MTIFRMLGQVTFFLLLAPCDVTASDRIFNVDYHLTLFSGKDSATVEIEVTNAQWLKSLDFNLEGSKCSQFRSAGRIVRQANRLLWEPEGEKAYLSFKCRIKNKRKSSQGEIFYDAYIEKSWALFRADDFVPPAKARIVKGAVSRARLLIDMPSHWQGVNTGWPREKNNSSDGDAKQAVFIIDNPKRKFDRPTGWVIAGELGTRRAYPVGQDGVRRQLLVSAPAASDVRQMDILTFVYMLWPEYEKAFVDLPSKLLITGAGKPMWRGALSAGNSLYLHAGRPLVSENGTSTVLHELFHVITGISGKQGSDWIAEGLAEYYAIILLKRVGGMSEERYDKTMTKLAKWSQGVDSLYAANSTGAITAAAVGVFEQLDSEIQQASGGTKSLDHLVRSLMAGPAVDKKDLMAAFARLTGKTSKVLQQGVRVE